LRTRKVQESRVESTRAKMRITKKWVASDFSGGAKGNEWELGIPVVVGKVLPKSLQKVRNIWVEEHFYWSWEKEKENPGDSRTRYAALVKDDGARGLNCRNMKGTERLTKTPDEPYVRLSRKKGSRLKGEKRLQRIAARGVRTRYVQRGKFSASLWGRLRNQKGDREERGERRRKERGFNWTGAKSHPWGRRWILN